MAARISLCGRLELELSGQRLEGRLPGRQGPLVIAVLAVNRARPVARDELIDALWPGRPPADPDEVLSALLAKVRRVVGKDVLQGRRDLTLALPDGAEIDVAEAYAAAERAQAAVAARDWQIAWDAGSAAVEITGRGFLIGLDGPWVQERRGELAELRLRALEAVAEAGVALGAAGAEPAARELTRAAPLRQAGHRLLMEALAARGEMAEALASYEALRVLLRDELGATPGDAVRAVHERLLAGDSIRPAAEPVPLPALLARDRGDLVGRAPELEAMRTAWADACAGRRRLLLLVGGPGIGKTRLAGELARDAHAGGTILFAGCLPDALVAYQPFVEALRHHARHAPLSGSGPGWAELARLIPELALPDAVHEAGDPETRRYLLFEAVSTALTDISERAPLLLVLDDLHWADRSTLQLLRHVVRAQHEAALLIVGSYRDLEVGRDHPLFELLADLRRDGLVERVSLGGLDRAGVGTLMTARAGEAAPPALVEAVYDKTDGNPFFVEEVVRHLVETGRWPSRLAPADIGVPEGVKEVIERRLARLSENCRSLLSQAAMLGREFAFDRLAAMTDSDEDAVIGALEEALGAGLVEEQGTAFSFSHALVRETLYGALSAPRRQRMHARAARAIEADDADDVDALAVHYRLAGPTLDGAKAIEYSLRAGDRARRLFAWDEAAAHWEGALGLIGDPAQRAGLLVALADLCAVLGDLERQIAHLEQALALHTELGDERRAAQVHSRLGMAHSLIDSIHADHLDIGRAFAHFDAARKVLDGGRALGHLETGIACAWTYGFHMPSGIESAVRAMEIAERCGDEALWAGAAETFAWLKIASGDLAEGFDAVERAFEVADRGQRPFLAWMALTIRGQHTWGIGDPDGAQPWFERMLDLSYAGTTAHARVIRDSLGRCHMSRGEVHAARPLVADAQAAWATHALPPLVDLWAGDWDRVQRLADRVLETSRRSGNRWDEFAAHHLAGRALALRGDAGAAVTRLEEARAIAHDAGAQIFELWAVTDLARALIDARDVAGARVHADRCAAIVGNGEDWRGRTGIAAVAEAVVLSHEGRADEADAAFVTALDTLQQFRLVPDEADARREWSLALTRADDRERAEEQRAQAAALYAANGAGAAWQHRLGAA